MVHYVLFEKKPDGTYREIESVPSLKSLKRAMQVAYELKKRKLEKGYLFDVDIFVASDIEAKQHDKKVAKEKIKGYVHF